MQRSISIDINTTSVKKAICIGENIRNTDFSLNVLGKKITGELEYSFVFHLRFHRNADRFYGMRAGRGGHLQPELLIVELLDETNQPVKAGEPGEVTITTLGVKPCRCYGIKQVICVCSLMSPVQLRCRNTLETVACYRVAKNK